MKKMGFVIEMTLLIVVLGVFVIQKGGWFGDGTMEIFSSSSFLQHKDKEPEKAKEAKSESGLAIEKEQDTEDVQEEENVILDPNSPAGRAAALGLPTPPSIDIDSWEYILVNSENRIDGSFAPEIGIAVSQSSESNQDIRIVDALDKFAADAEAQGLEVYLSSGYRSYETQSYLFELKCEEYDYDTAATIVAIPGTSEHQTGLCCDITDVYRDPKNSELENTETYKWMSAHCAEYGFIVRFPKGKEDITKIIYEPWHFRYVGVDAATYIMENNLTLEEFVAIYKG